MTDLPLPRDLQGERDRLFSLLYSRAVTHQEHIIDTYFLQSQGVKYGLRNHLIYWQKMGLGRVIEERNSCNEHFLHFVLNDDGVRYGERLLERSERNRLGERLRRNLWPAANAVASLIAAVAAVLAAYFAYVGAKH